MEKLNIKGEEVSKYTVAEFIRANPYGSIVPWEAQSGVSAIAAGAYHSLALKDGNVIVWGSHSDGEFDVPTEAQSGVSAIAGGFCRCLALKDGKVIFWGNPCGSVPWDVQSGVSAIAAGDFHSLALKNGTVIAWGGNTWGESDVPWEAQSGVSAIAAGSDHSLALISGSSSAGTLQFEASSVSVNENAGSVSLSVTRSGGSSGVASANYATANGTASAGTDYTATSGDFTWADGNSDNKTITVPISDDSVADGDKYFTVQLSSASGASLGSPYSVTVTIVDNDTPPFTLSASISLLSGFGELYLNNTISFSANVVGAQGTVSYQWDLSGDGSFGDASGQQVSYQYSTEGTRLVQVRVNDGYQSTTASLFVTIGKAPQPDEPTPPPAIDPESGDPRAPSTGAIANSFKFDNSTKRDKGLIIIIHGIVRAAWRLEHVLVQHPRL